MGAVPSLERLPAAAWRAEGVVRRGWAEVREQASAALRGSHRPLKTVSPRGPAPDSEQPHEGIDPLEATGNEPNSTGERRPLTDIDRVRGRGRQNQEPELEGAAGRPRATRRLNSDGSEIRRACVAEATPASGVRRGGFLKISLVRQATGIALSEMATSLTSPFIKPAMRRTKEGPQA